MLAGLELGGVVGGVQLGDLGALAGGNMRERLDPLRAQALGLGKPFVRDGVVKRVIEHSRSPAEGTSGAFTVLAPLRPKAVFRGGGRLQLCLCFHSGVSVGERG